MKLKYFRRLCSWHYKEKWRGREEIKSGENRNWFPLQYPLAISENSTTTKILQLSGTKNTPVQNKLLHKSHSNCCQGILLTGGVGLQLSSAVPQSKSFVYKSCSEQNLRFELAGSTENFFKVSFWRCFHIFMCKTSTKLEFLYIL